LKNPLAITIVGGATISFIPSIIVGWLANAFPSIAPEELQIVSDFFGSGIGPLQLIVFMMIVFIIPPIEEILFRGWLWKMCKLKFSTNRTWIITSLVFAAVHAEPLHILGLLPLSFFLGWLRKKTGGIECSMIAHMTNNAVACLLMVL
jgi:membrane protease YdiL (CAAX protease family)